MDYRPHYPMPLRALSGVIDVTLVLGGTSIVALVFTNALLRGAAGFDLAWSLEVTAFLLLWTTFLGAAAAMARGAHMRVTEIVENLVPRAAQIWLALFIDLIIAAMLVSLIWYGVSIASHNWAQKTTVLYWPVGLLYASMPAGMACALVFHLFNMVRDWRIPQKRSADDADTGATL
ncbi:TRAP transporter small permease [Sulfitobacter sp. SK012]|uniref:TRAP transporter small permease n=1 Tax=Sulfitobacter sp. SK012 TaxID=1389005 RepID=UPI000E0A9504|nr:TRAP transporter small permease subunit [Sulfitobacter sp. SK012]AXI47648.1 TRAP transporter small permease [Sulfitobacter sp. SK012]